MPTTVRVEAARSLLERMGEKNALLRFFRLNACAKHGVPISDHDIWSRNIIVDQPENTIATQPAASASATQPSARSGVFPWATLAAVVSTLLLGLGGGYLASRDWGKAEEKPAAVEQPATEKPAVVEKPVAEKPAPMEQKLVPGSALQYIEDKGGHLP
jgi:hypothetical protein